MATPRAPKQWCLGKTETVNSFKNWRQNLVYTLSLDPNFAPFLVEGVQWGKKSKTSPHRGFLDDGDGVARDKRLAKEQKVTILDLMLGQIANYCPVISRNTIVKNSTSVDNIWQTIRLHFGFQSTGAHFIDFSSIRLQPDERPEDLYQRLMTFVEDNLLRRDLGITHHGTAIEEDEELTPTMENFIVLTWLRLINPDLPKHVKQRYGTELRSRTLASIKPEISQALDSLLEELQTSEDAKIMRTAASRFNSYNPSKSSNVYTSREKAQPYKCCPLCKEAGRPDSHYLSKCTYLPKHDKKYIAKARQIVGILDDSEDSNCEDDSLTQGTNTSTAVNRVKVRQSPYLDVFYEHYKTRLTIDSGATGNMIRAVAAKNMNVRITSSSQSAHQADGSSPLSVIGEARMTFTRGNHKFYFEGLVVENLDVDILAGIPFMEHNDISIRPAKREIALNGTTIFNYGSLENPSDRHSIRRAPSCATTIWPGEFLEVDIPSDMYSEDDIVALEPHISGNYIKTDISTSWPSANLIPIVSGKIRIPNLTEQPQTLKRNEHFCQVRSTTILNTDNSEIQTLPKRNDRQSPLTRHSDKVQLDPDNLLSQEMKVKFKETLVEFDDVFNPEFKGYNGAVGPFQAKVNMGPVQPPQRKGRIPQYSRNQLSDLQQQFDDLEHIGVFKRPEDINVSVEYLNPSFLVKKPNGGFRLVTAFADVGRYSKPQPSLMPDVDSTLRLIAQWKYIITTDLTKSFYQIPLSKDSMKYCGVVTPFRGVRVYVRSAMGMPGSETALEELMCRVLGDFVEKGIVAKIADDLYCGGNTPEELLLNWRKVLQALQKCSLNLSASKTVVTPKQTNILGWIWQTGSIRANPHRIATLSSCSRPTTISGLRSFIGAYKVLARVIPNTASFLSALDDITTGRDSKDSIAWTDELSETFEAAQRGLSSNKSITLPRRDDQLWIVTDGSVKQHGLGATLYISRSDKVLLAGFFSTKLRKRQVGWLPCEIEALAIATAIKHFSPYIIQSTNTTCVLTDSKPCVQAFEKLCRGEFSASPRVSTFLSTASRYQVSIRHVAGSAILPSDFASRNAADCNDPTCQICTFVQLSENSVVRHVSTTDILDGTAKLPFTSRSAWLSIQSECPDLRRAHAHLKQGTRPSKKLTNIKDVKRYINVASIAKDGLLIVKRNEPLTPTRECILVPRQVLDGLITSLHIKLDHPSTHQLKTVVHRYFYALDMDKSIEQTTAGCHQCASLKKIPKMNQSQSTGDPPEVIGSRFSADVIKRERQLIMVVREYVTSYTVSCLIEDERKETLRDAILCLCIELRPIDGPCAVIRTDPAPGFTALVSDELLSKYRISIEIGRAKNKNKNPIAERAIQELEDEILRQEPLSRIVTPVLLALATARLNSRIRKQGLSAREMWTQRDQFSCEQIPVADQKLISSQHERKLVNHAYSEKSKNPLGKYIETPKLHIGDIVYLYSDRNKSSARDRYIIVSMEDSWCNIRKFVGSQLRNSSYRVRNTDCYKIQPTHEKLCHPRKTYIDNDSDEEDLADKTLCNPSPPNIPNVISDPPEYQNNLQLETVNELELHELSDNEDNTNLPDTSPIINRPKRERRKPCRLDDYILY